MNTGDAIVRTLESVNVADVNGEPANIVDSVAGLAGVVRNSGRDISDALNSMAESIRDLADAIRQHGRK